MSKISAKDLAKATLGVARERGMAAAARGLFEQLKKKNQLKILSQVLSELERVEEAEGRLMTRIFSADALSASQLKEIESAVLKISGAEQVTAVNIVDPKVLGGVKITFGDKIIDQTIKSRINQLRIKLVSRP